LRSSALTGPFEVIQGVLEILDARFEHPKRFPSDPLGERLGEKFASPWARSGSGGRGLAVHPQAFGQAIALARRGGTIVFIGLPPGDVPAPTFDIVLKGLTIRGSIVGTRQDLAEALDFYARGLVKPTVTSARLDDINDVFDRMERGQIDGRIVIDYRNGQAAG
jgi:threonine dehydrogenase-like Zn-dependent dehydrogenase